MLPSHPVSTKRGLMLAQRRRRWTNIKPTLIQRLILLSLTCHPPISAICVQETWLSEEDDSSLFNLNGYNCISKGKTCSQKGGLIIYLNENFTYKTIDIAEPSTLWESQVIEISSPALSKKVIPGNFYRRPKENVADHKQFIDELSPILPNLESLNAEVILAGDFNINLSNIKNKDTASNFFNTITAHVFFQKLLYPLDSLITFSVKFRKYL